MTRLSLQLSPFAHNSLAFSPFYENQVALASGTNFSLVGNGRVSVVQFGEGVEGGKGIGVMRGWDTRDGVYDVAWSEVHENQLAAALGNGSIKLYDVTLDQLPIRSWHEHTAEIMTLEWNNLQKDVFVTASWDQTVKIWSPSRETSLLTVPAHPSQIYGATFSPHSPTILASCGSDGFIRIWDTRLPTPSPTQHSIPPPPAQMQASQSVQQINPNQGEILSIDFNKYVPHLLAFSSQDGSVSTVDLRNTPRGAEGMGVRQVGKAKLGARKVRWDPHASGRMASGGYDMACRIWQTTPQPREVYTHTAHTEFVMGVEWALFDPGLIGSCGWDGRLDLYRV
ncbi:hypothetical protein IAR50_001807 [Cryptococcus sp. DSM 104548]